LLEEDADLLGLLVEGQGRKDGGDDGEGGEDRDGYGGQLGREDERHGGSVGAPGKRGGSSSIDHWAVCSRQPEQQAPSGVYTARVRRFGFDG
jgi:hypothetical protein